MKKCYKCGFEKPLDAFSKNAHRKDGLSAQCKECHKTLRKQHYEKNKEKVLEQVGRWRDEYVKWFENLKDKPCMDCGRTFPPYCLDFDHLRDKEFTISKAFRYNWSKKRILKEIDKCELVCAVCHRIRTYNRLHH